MSDPTTQSARYVATVKANGRICDEHYRLVLSLPRIAPTAPGQFMQFLCEQPGLQIAPHEAQRAAGGWPTLTQAELTGVRPLLRRPLSIAGRRGKDCGGVELEFVYHQIGAGTGWLAAVRPGQSVDMLGPLGNRFNIDTGRPLAAMIGGGVGIAPMLYLAEALAAAGVKAVAFNGARTASLLPLTLPANCDVSPAGRPTRCAAEFDAFGVETSIATDDGSLGIRGLVTEPFERWLDGLDSPADELTVYTCGPEPMMRAVAEICVSRRIPCQVSLERHMACGMGTCQSCICKVRDDSATGWAFKLCCKDGPVFNAADIIWP